MAVLMSPFCPMTSILPERYRILNEQNPANGNAFTLEILQREFAEVETALIRELQREGIALAKERGASRERKRILRAEQIAELQMRTEAGGSKTMQSRDFGISRDTVCHYLHSQGQA